MAAINRSATDVRRCCPLAASSPCTSTARIPISSVTGNRSNVVPVRDSTTPHGPRLVFRAEAWSAFVDDLKRDRPQPRRGQELTYMAPNVWLDRRNRYPRRAHS
uniref:DUF397 domain-containing protein n=1 Tax=Streptomyces sp. TG1A-60 TaxID=3129111 RepID=UPI00403FFB88